MVTVDYYSEMANAIIKSQEELIGSIAWEQASNVEGLVVQDKSVQVTSPMPQETLNNLVKIYEIIFGQAAVEVCKTAARRIGQGLDSEYFPASLR